jgi:cobalt/nickel transport system permease protein
VRDEEIPRIALLTAAFFVASLVHVRVGPTSVHLLLNGLVGVLLGGRAALAIGVGLALQALLIGHGGYNTLGVNTCILALPALLCGALFRRLHALPGLTRPAGRLFTVGGCGLLWFLCAAYSLLLLRGGWRQLGYAEALAAGESVFHPLTLALGLLFAAAVAWAEARLENAPEFPLGLLVGLLSVLLTVALGCAVLLLGGETVWPVPVLVWVVAHLPVAVVEGAVLGCAVGFLAKVKPDLLGMPAPPVAGAVCVVVTDAPPVLKAEPTAPN